MLLSNHSMTFKKNINEDNTYTDDTADPDFPNVDIDHGLNEEISTDEIKKAIQLLKNNKASGLDNITNKYIKCSIEMMLPVYQKIFN